MPIYSDNPTPPPLTQEELDALAAEQAAMGGYVPEGGYAPIPEPVPVQTGPAGQAAQVAGAVPPPEIAAAGSTAYDTPMPLEDGGVYVPPPPAGPPPEPAYNALDGTTQYLEPVPAPAPLVPAGTAPPPTQVYEYPTATAGPPVQGQYGVPELAPGYGEQITPAPPDAAQGYAAPEPMGNAISGAGDWLRTNVVEPFQRNSADTSVFGVDVGPLLAPAPTPDPPSGESGMPPAASAGIPGAPGYGWNAARARLEAGYGLPEPAPTAVPLVTGSGVEVMEQLPIGNSPRPATETQAPGGGGWYGSSAWGGRGSYRSIPHDGGGSRSGSQAPRDVGSDVGESPFSNPVFDRFVATLAASNPAWLAGILGMTPAGGARSSWRSSRRGGFDRTAFRQMARRMGSGRARSDR